MAAPASAFVNLAPVEQVPEGQLKVFRAGARRIAVSQIEGKFYAIDDICTHDGGPLGESGLDGEEVECPRHGARFNVKSGAATQMPAIAPVIVYEVRVENGHIQVKI
jgi:3-phenylpropionate/trans-cinnamate dioxygenase ferredoxin subunit